MGMLPNAWSWVIITYVGPYGKHHIAGKMVKIHIVRDRHVYAIKMMTNIPIPNPNTKVLTAVTTVTVGSHIWYKYGVPPIG